MKNVVNDTFDPHMLQGIDRMDLSEARITCKGIIEDTSTKEKKKAALLRDIDASPTSQDLSRMMWNVYLAGEGLYIGGSSWQNRF